MMLRALDSHLSFLSPAPAAFSPGYNTTVVAKSVVTDLTVCFSSSFVSPPTCGLDPRKWHRLEKELHLHTAKQTAYLFVELANEEDLSAEDLVVVDIGIGKQPPQGDSNCAWESRPGGLWVQKEMFSNIGEAVTEVDALFGVDAVDPRPEWTLLQSHLQLNTPQDTPVARLSVLHGRVESRPEDRPTLRVKANGKFKIVQFADAHMATGVGICTDAIDADRRYLSEREADPLTVRFFGEILDAENPDLVVFTGDQLHHDILDSQSALFKVFSPVIERSIPFAAVFGNHDSEGSYALSRKEQMAILEKLPFSLCEPGPEQVDGVGNFYLQILAPAPSRLSLATLFFLDSHGEVPGKLFGSSYDHIKQSQIDWLLGVSEMLRDKHKKGVNEDLSVAFFHIPLPEFADDDRLKIYGGRRREPTEGPRYNSRFYDALVKERISAVGCGHDYVNDFCALLQRLRETGMKLPGPWLCYGGGVGFGGYCSYGGERYHRRARIWELNTNNGGLKTWKRVEYELDRVDEMYLVKGGLTVNSVGKDDESCAVS